VVSLEHISDIAHPHLRVERRGLKIAWPRSCSSILRMRVTALTRTFSKSARSVSIF
jgi:hypothetical protein